MKKKIVVSVLLVLLFMGSVFAYKRYYLSNTQQEVSAAQSAKKNNTSSLLTPTTTNFSANSAIENAKLKSVNTTLGKNSFIGAYIGLKNGKFVFSQTSGYPNATLKTAFGYGSIIRVGKFQSLINIAMLLNSVENHDITKSDDLSKYVPELKLTSKLTLSDLIDNTNGISVDTKSLRGLKETQAIKKYFKIVKINSSKSDVASRQDGSDILIAIIVSRIEHQTYSATLKSFLNEFEFNGTAVVGKGAPFTRANVLSYQKSEDSNGSPLENKPYQNVDANFTFGIDQLRMSLLDVINTVYVINDNKYFSSKYDKYLKEYYAQRQTKRTGFYLSNSGLYSSAHGYFLSLTFDNHGKNQVLVAENYPNSGLRGLSLTKKLFSKGL